MSFVHEHGKLTIRDDQGPHLLRELHWVPGGDGRVMVTTHHHLHNKIESITTGLLRADVVALRDFLNGMLA